MRARARPHLELRERGLELVQRAARASARAAAGAAAARHPATGRHLAAALGGWQRAHGRPAARARDLFYYT